MAEAKPLPETEAEAISEEAEAEAKLLTKTEEEAVGETAEPLPAIETVLPQVTAEKSQIRFAEDILVSVPTKPGPKQREKKKKRAQSKDMGEDGIRLRKKRLETEIYDAEEY